MTIALCTHNANLEGAPLHLLELAMLLQNEGNTVLLLSPKNGPLLQLAKQKNVPCRVVPCLYDEDFSMIHLQQDLPLHLDLIIVNTILGARIVEIVHTAPVQVPILWIIHESEGQEIMDNNAFITPDIFTMADAVLFTAYTTKTVYEQWDTGNMHVIHNGIHLDTESISRYQSQKHILRENFLIPPNAQLVSLIGTVCPRKGQKEFTEAAIAVLLAMPKEYNVHFAICGRLDIEYEKYLSQPLATAEKFGFKNHFHVLPETKDPMEYFAMTDIYVCNSFIESFPLVILEAMSFGLPIAASNTYGVAEQLTHKEDGLLHLPGHSSQLAQNIRTLLNNPSLCKRLGDNAKKRVYLHFNQATMSEAYNALIANITKKSQALEC
jgi:glycosyltransferase involved in cell wall biosynthesis